VTRAWDWRDAAETAADFALLGIAVTVAALPLVTLGAALSVGTVATAHWYEHRTMPPVRDLARLYVRGILPGLGVLGVLVAAAVVLGLDLRLASSGRVPGGRALVILTLLTLVALLGLAALTLVERGRGNGWRGAVREAGRLAGRRPVIPLALAGIALLSGLLGSMVPVTSPLLVGYTVFACHIVTARLDREPSTVDGP
jgi:hypothetical protein